MIELSSFIKAQQVVWFKRTHKANIDNWRHDLTTIFDNNCLTANHSFIDHNTNPILYGISESFVSFCKNFYSKDDNYKSSLLLNNPIIFRERGSDRILDKNFFTQNPPVDFTKLALLKFSDCFANGQAVHLDTINIQFNLNLNLATYMRLIGALSNFYRSLKRGRLSDGTSVSLSTLFSSPARGSRTLRNVFSHSINSKIKIENQTNVRTFFRLIQLPLLDNKILPHILSSWNNVCLSNNYREFLFKFFNNCLGINTRLSHFVLNFSRNCTFCAIGGRNTDETFKHLFFDCPTTNSLMRKFEGEFLANFLHNNNDKVRFWFTGTPPAGIFNLFLHHCALTFHFIIWEFKVKKKIPSFYTFKLNYFSKLKKMRALCSTLMYDVNNFDLPLCRNIQALALRYGDEDG
jgi:hypothetical protein